MATGAEQGRFEVNFNHNLKLLDVESRDWCNIRGCISCISRVLSQFCVQKPSVG